MINAPDPVGLGVRGIIECAHLRVRDARSVHGGCAIPHGDGSGAGLPIERMNSRPERDALRTMLATC